MDVRHVLVREAITARLVPGERRRLHAAMAACPGARAEPGRPLGRGARLAPGAPPDRDGRDGPRHPCTRGGRRGRRARSGVRGSRPCLSDHPRRLAGGHGCPVRSGARSVSGARPCRRCGLVVRPAPAGHRAARSLTRGRAASSADPERRARLRLRLGRVLAETGRWDAAIEMHTDSHGRGPGPLGTAAAHPHRPGTDADARDALRRSRRSVRRMRGTGTRPGGAWGRVGGVVRPGRCIGDDRSRRRRRSRLSPKPERSSLSTGRRRPLGHVQAASRPPWRPTSTGPWCWSEPETWARPRGWPWPVPMRRPAWGSATRGATPFLHRRRGPCSGWGAGTKPTDSRRPPAAVDTAPPEAHLVRAMLESARGSWGIAEAHLSRAAVAPGSAHGAGWVGVAAAISADLACWQRHYQEAREVVSRGLREAHAAGEPSAVVELAGLGLRIEADAAVSARARRAGADVAVSQEAGARLWAELEAAGSGAGARSADFRLTDGGVPGDRIGGPGTPSASSGPVGAGTRRGGVGRCRRSVRRRPGPLAAGRGIPGARSAAVRSRRSHPRCPRCRRAAWRRAAGSRGRAAGSAGTAGHAGGSATPGIGDQRTDGAVASARPGSLRARGRGARASGRRAHRP